MLSLKLLTLTTLAATAEAASHAKTLAAVTVDIAPAKVTISGTAGAATNNWDGGSNDLSVTAKVDIADADTAVTVTTAIDAKTKECKVDPAVIETTVTVQLKVPDALKTALDLLANAITLPITSDKLEAAYTVSIADKKDGDFAVSLREYATGDIKAALMLSGSDITIQVEKIGVKQAGILIPLTATLSIGDPKLLEIPTDKACGKGSKVCVEDNYGVTGANTYTLSGKACQTFCNAVKAIKDTAVFEKKINLAEKFSADTKDGFVLGDTSKECKSKLGAASTNTVDYGIAFAAVGSVIMALFV